ncbi:MAG: hypothetical protein ABIY52_07925 [Gemmatimonadaceae bacterium]
MPSFRENLRLANALRVVLLSGRASTEIGAGDVNADPYTGTHEAARLALVVTGAFRTPPGSQS